ncbi:hypothetical protein LAZ67_10001118 [Cordylochernes scorpioides]|uniref:Uncharacterized protein n=1 Tax=Cordylochernes scorpioides TaxID=51811 RepID=A0ABY6KVJ8_9ARAC|nr:hypothetical protein LAZ67_10001118 [Cordylochernes scorpioides]
MTQRRGKKTVQIRSENEQRWRNKPDHSNETSKQSLPKIFTEETPPQRTSAYPLTDRQRREQADRANDSPDIPASHGNRAAMWPKPCDKFHAFDLTSSRQCSRQQATINFTEATSVYKLYMERLQRQQEYKPRPSFLTELSHNYYTSNGWCIDSGASMHMAGDKSFLNKIYQNREDDIFLPDGKSMNDELIGEDYITCVLPIESPKQILGTQKSYIVQLFDKHGAVGSAVTLVVAFGAPYPEGQERRHGFAFSLYVQAGGQPLDFYAVVEEDVGLTTAVCVAILSSFELLGSDGGLRQKAFRKDIAGQTHQDVAIYPGELDDMPAPPPPYHFIYRLKVLMQIKIGLKYSQLEILLRKKILSFYGTVSPAVKKGYIIIQIRRVNMKVSYYGSCSQPPNKKRPYCEKGESLPSAKHMFKFNSMDNIHNFACRTFESILVNSNLNNPEKRNIATKALLFECVKRAELLLEDTFKGVSLSRPQPTGSVADARNINSKLGYRVDKSVQDEDICDSIGSNHSVQELSGKQAIKIVHYSRKATQSTETVFVEVDDEVAEISDNMVVFP